MFLLASRTSANTTPYLIQRGLYGRASCPITRGKAVISQPFDVGRLLPPH